MAKIAFSKLNLKSEPKVEKLVWNDVEIEVSTYLPIEKKSEVIANIINKSVDDNGYYNPLRVKMNMVLEVVFAYTNLTFTDKQKENPGKLYDLFAATGFGDMVVDAIGDKEWYNIEDYTWDTIKSVYEYKNSVMGILDTVTTNYSEMDLDAQKLKENIGNPENLELLRSILSKLG